MTTLSELWVDDQGQDIAEYAVMLAAILVVVIGTIRLVASNANNVFSQVASSISKRFSQRWTAGKPGRRPMGSRREGFRFSVTPFSESATGVLGEGSYFNKRPAEEGRK